MTSSIVFAVLYGVLSFAKSVSFIMENRSHRKMLTNKGPKMDPCGTPNKIPSQGLYDEFTLGLCFLLSTLLSDYESASMPQC